MDIFNVTPVSKNMSPIAGALMLDGQGGDDFVIFDDRYFGPPSFTINSFTDTPFTTSHAAAMSYGNVEHIQFYGSDDSSLTTVKSLPAHLSSISLYGDGGSDSFLIGEAATGLAPVGLTAIAIDGGVGGDSITIHDEANLADDVYTFTSTTFDK